MNSLDPSRLVTGASGWVDHDVGKNISLVKSLKLLEYLDGMPFQKHHINKLIYSITH